VLVVEGDKNKKIVADFATLAPKKPPPPPPPPPPPAEKKGSSISPGVFIAGGVALVAVGGFTTFAILGKNEEKKLAGDGGCKPNCSSDQVSPVKRDYLVADVALGVAVVATAVAVYFAVTSSGKSSAAKSPPATWSVSF
jgi:hypothetical protein